MPFSASSHIVLKGPFLEAFHDFLKNALLVFSYFLIWCNHCDLTYSKNSSANQIAPYVKFEYLMNCQGIQVEILHVDRVSYLATLQKKTALSRKIWFFRNFKKTLGESDRYFKCWNNFMARKHYQNQFSLAYCAYCVWLH